MDTQEQQLEKVQVDFASIERDCDFQTELCNLINRHSVENESNTPDFILAQYMMGCLDAFTKASLAREKWFGKSLTI
jgi:hypothetical protein